VSPLTTAPDPPALPPVTDTLTELTRFIDIYGDDLGSYVFTGGQDGAIQLLAYCVDRRELLARSRAIGGRFDKSVDNTLGYFHLDRTIAPGLRLRLYTTRSAVCEQVVTTETIEITEPDPDQVAALPTRTRTETIERVEWRCPDQLLASPLEAA
jgi:hypothetical protein